MSDHNTDAIYADIVKDFDDIWARALILSQDKHDIPGMIVISTASTISQLVLNKLKDYNDRNSIRE